jgi:integrase/recombinase XerD
MKAAAEQPREVRTFCGVMHYTGCRISEALEITPRSIDLSARVVIFRSLKNASSGSSALCPPRLTSSIWSTWSMACARSSRPAKA